MLPDRRTQAARTPHLRKISREAAVSFVLRTFSRPAHPFLWHYHPEIEICYAQHGGGIRFVSDSIEPFHDGDIFLVGANVPHTLFSEPRARGRATWLVLQFLPECLGETFLNAPEARAIRAMLQRAQRGLLVKGATRRAVAALFEKLAREPETSPRRLLGFIHILVLLAESRDLKTLANTDGSTQLSAASNLTINRVLGNFGAHADEWPSQSQAAEMAGMTPPAFSRFFKRCMHKTYVRYVNELRIGCACRLLIENQTTITDAAFRSGFYNLSNFNEQFRAIKGLSPSQYVLRARVKEDLGVG
jgi:AraC-like DNA-binding protein